MGISGSTTVLRRSAWPQPPAQSNPGRELDAVQSTDVERRYEPARAAPTEFLFGPFRLIPARFLLLEGDKPVRLGSRALEILVLLLERPGELISKQELIARVWPHVFVEPANLTVHVSVLRRALRDGRDGNRFIINIPGRGYVFVAPVEVLEHESRARPAALAGLLPAVRSS